MFDICIVGAGCAGMQLLQQLSLQKNWSSQKILLIDDGSEKQQSWCFWSTSAHPLQHLVSKTWHQLCFKSANFKKCESISPYAYHYISGRDFFNYFFQQFIPAHSNITLINARVNEITKQGNSYQIGAPGKYWQAKNCFSSIAPVIPEQPVTIWQHFKGWYIKMASPVFDDNAAVLMDFSTSAAGPVNFIYLLPFSKDTALIEATYFSAELMPDEKYDSLIQNYLEQVYPGSEYSVNSTEKGCIPMSQHPFSRYGSAGEVLLGKAAGMTKASTGYTFNRITRDSQLLACSLSEHQPYQWPHSSGKFRFYDHLLLSILAQQPHLAPQIFTSMFKHQPVKKVLSFLNEESSFAKEAAIFSTLPVKPFIAEAFKYIFK